MHVSARSRTQRSGRRPGPVSLWLSAAPWLGWERLESPRRALSCRYGQLVQGTMARLMLTVLLLSASSTTTAASTLGDTNGPKPPNCPQYHTLSFNDPSGPVQTPDGTWHIFPINGNWGHCTSPNLLTWNCSHPSTGWPFDNTGGITVTPVGYFLTQANNYNVRQSAPAACCRRC